VLVLDPDIPGQDANGLKVLLDTNERYMNKDGWIKHIERFTTIANSQAASTSRTDIGQGATSTSSTSAGNWRHDIFGSLDGQKTVPRVPFDDLKAWILRNVSVEIGAEVWTSLKPTVESYSAPGFVSVIKLLDFANRHDPQGGDLIVAVRKFIQHHANGSRILLGPQTLQYSQIESMIEKSQSSSHPFTITLKSLEEIRNSVLEAKFFQGQRDVKQRQEHRRRRHSDESGEQSRLLFHGTTPRAVEDIIVNGFRVPEETIWDSMSRFLRLKSTPMFGYGIYITPVSTKRRSTPI
jgi:hypothetical protein